jgi:hypothetical protein
MREREQESQRKRDGAREPRYKLRACEREREVETHGSSPRPHSLFLLSLSSPLLKVEREREKQIRERVSEKWVLVGWIYWFIKCKSHPL